MPLAGVEPTMPVSERPQTDALDRTDTAIGNFKLIYLIESNCLRLCPFLNPLLLFAYYRFYQIFVFYMNSEITKFATGL
jgi:hypothetical protein